MSELQQLTRIMTLLSLPELFDLPQFARQHVEDSAIWLPTAPTAGCFPVSVFCHFLRSWWGAFIHEIFYLSGCISEGGLSEYQFQRKFSSLGRLSGHLPALLDTETPALQLQMLDASHRDMVALRATSQKPVLQGQKTSSHKFESTRRNERPSPVPAPANLAVRKHANASR